jgi:aminoglycoside phosphotransferase (APT) family kinase protein
VDLLGLFDRLRRHVETRTTDRVITHGEPHAANVMWTDDGPLLIDWDTNALAPPERDLWMVLSDSGEAAAYAVATGHQPDPVAIDFYRLTWDLANVAAYVDVFRSAHADTDDMSKSYANLLKDLAVRDRWAKLLAWRER